MNVVGKVIIGTALGAVVSSVVTTVALKNGEKIVNFIDNRKSKKKKSKK